MSESQTDAAAPAATCPLPLDALPAQFRKHVDPAAPAKLRMMAAKGLIPMPPGDQVTALCMLSYDPEEDVRATAAKTAASLPDRILATTLRGALPPAVLDFLAGELRSQPSYLEMILLNQDTSDETFARLAPVVDEKLLAIVSDNQLRLLRHPDIIRGLVANPTASKATVDRVLDFAVRSGLDLPDLEVYQEARRRILGDEEAARKPEKEETAEGLLDAYAEDLAEERDDDAVEEDDELLLKRDTLTQKVMRMTVSEKIKLAMRGNKEARTLLLRDANRLVQEAVVSSPRITDGELIGMTNNRTISDTILGLILKNRDVMRNYQAKVNLVNNPKTPLPTAMRLLPHLQPRDLKALARSRNVPNALSTQARTLTEKKTRK